MCVLFNVTADTVQKDGIVYAWFKIREASGGRGGNGKGRCGAGARPREPSTCSNTGPLMQFHTLEYYIVHVDVAVVRNGKRERLHIQ